MIYTFDKQLEIDFDHPVNKPRFVPNVAQLKQWYEEIRKKYFGDTIPPVNQIQFSIAKIKKKWLACAGANLRYNRKTRAITQKPTCFSITFNSIYAATYKSLYYTMAHEMCHIYVYKNYDYYPRDGHGKEFMNIAQSISTVSGIDIAECDTVKEHGLSDIAKKKMGTKINLAMIQFSKIWVILKTSQHCAINMLRSYIGATKLLTFSIDTDDDKLILAPTARNNVHTCLFTAIGTKETCIKELNKKYSIQNLYPTSQFIKENDVIQPV